MMYENLFSMVGKAVLITGGSGFLGSAITEALLAFGANVSIADLTEVVLSNDKDKERYISIACDVSSTPSIQEAFRIHQAAWGRLDVLVNCAYYGAGYGLDAQLETMSDETWAKGVDGAAGTTFRCIREAIPYLRESQGGAIINIGSMYGIISPDPAIYGDSGANNPPNYGAGKAAVLQLTRYCAAHLAQYGIRCNSISPGPFPNTKIAQNEDFLAQLNQKTMLRRVGKPHELTGAIMLLASEASSYMTGTNITVDGGWTAW